MSSTPEKKLRMDKWIMKTPDEKDQSISGYVGSVGDIRSSNPKEGGKISKFFEFYIHTNAERRRSVCFSPQKRSYLLELSSRKQGVVLEKIKNEKDIILKQNSLIKEVKLDFEKTEPKLIFNTLREILFSKEVYDQVNINVTIQNLSSTEEKITNNGILKLRSATAVDDKEEIPITFFNGLGDDISDGQRLEITYCTISMYYNDRVLKTTTNSRVKLVHNARVNLFKSTSTEINGKACSVDYCSFLPTYACPSCKSILNADNLDDGFLSCSNCNALSCEDDGLIVGDVRFTFMEKETKKKQLLHTELRLLSEAYGVKFEKELAKAMLRTPKTLTVINDKVTKIMDVKTTTTTTPLTCSNDTAKTMDSDESSTSTYSKRHHEHDE